MTLILVLTSMIVFAAAYAIKGGQIKHVFPGVNDGNGKVLSAILVLLYVTIMTLFLEKSVGVFSSMEASVVAIVAGWILAIAPALGKELGALMNTGAYVESPLFGRKFGINKAIQRGVWMGAIMALATGYLPFICFSFLYAPISWAALTYGYKKGWDGWALSELFVGATVLGIPFGLSL